MVSLALKRACGRPILLFLVQEHEAREEKGSKDWPHCDRDTPRSLNKGLEVSALEMLGILPAIEMMVQSVDPWCTRWRGFDAQRRDAGGLGVPKEKQAHDLTSTTTSSAIHQDVARDFF